MTIVCKEMAFEFSRGVIIGSHLGIRPLDHLEILILTIPMKSE